MKQFLRSRVARTSSYVEIYLSVLLIAGILVVSISLIMDIVSGVQDMLIGKFDFNYTDFLGLALKLIIGIEFVKMISKHTPESTFDVLLFAIARKIIIAETGYFDIIIGIISIAVLFVIKKFLYTPNISNPLGVVLDASTSVGEANTIAKTSIPALFGKSLSEIVTGELKRLGKQLEEGVVVIVDSARLKIYSMQDGEIDKVEVIPNEEKRNFFGGKIKGIK
ncbi:MAG: hypothetical protein Q7J78_02250 [Clostridiales bacterium]|nr:hypothetical protein [Clostridiales bacterium]